MTPEDQADEDADDYNDARRKLVGDRASLDLRPGSPDGRDLGAAPSSELGWPHVSPVLAVRVRLVSTAIDDYHRSPT